ncbi:MAG: nitrous oxide reductase family maturation protein NosD [Ignavibacteria bacterium]|nr:nitrous oxide reductase family maturation protein NosD [Ignavibacteria bacterium]
MKRIYYILIILAIANINICSKDIIVRPGGSIKSAVESSEAGDRVIVKEGFYKEYEIVINKSIELIGEGNPTIDGISKGEIIVIRADSVTVKGFYVNNSGFSGMRDYAAIRVENSRYCTISANKLVNNYFGIYLAGCNDCTVIYNEAMSNAISESSSGNGIHLWKCSNISILNNTITGHRDGIYFEFVTSSLVQNNSTFRNIRYGLHFMFSNGCDYENNVFTENGAGVAVMYTKNVKMINNRFENNWGANSYGLLLKDISDSFIYRNTFAGNTAGVYSEGVTRLNIVNNNFTANGYALKILGNCTDDTIKNNNFGGNTFDVTTNSSRNSNFFAGNYWDKYKGYDLDKDGTGDVSYRPVNLFSKIVEETPESVFLLRSFIVDLLDAAEKVVPVFIPETLIDDEPSMERVD